MAGLPSDFEQAKEKARSYLGNAQIQECLGGGIDGIVFSTDRSTALKVVERAKLYQAELNAYLRLRECDVSTIADCAVPRLVGWDDELQIIELTIVQQPYILDFAKSALDERQDFPDHVWEEWKVQKQEEFGSDWSKAAAAYDELVRRCGIYHGDLSPRNFAFGESGD